MCRFLDPNPSNSVEQALDTAQDFAFKEPSWNSGAGHPRTLGGPLLWSTLLRGWALCVPGTIHCQQKSRMKFDLEVCLCAADSWNTFIFVYF